MNKNIVVVTLLIITLLSVVFAFFQQTAATRARFEAGANLMLAQQAKNEGQKQAELAREEAQRATEALANLQQELEKCKGKK